MGEKSCFLLFLFIISLRFLTHPCSPAPSYAAKHAMGEMKALTTYTHPRLWSKMATPTHPSSCPSLTAVQMQLMNPVGPAKGRTIWQETPNAFWGGTEMAHRLCWASFTEKGICPQMVLKQQVGAPSNQRQSGINLNNPQAWVKQFVNAQWNRRQEDAPLKRGIAESLSGLPWKISAALLQAPLLTSAFRSHEECSAKDRARGDDKSFPARHF